MAKPSVQEAIGHVMLSWSALEFIMGMILAVMLETDQATGVVVSAALDYRHRRDLISSLAAFKLKGSEAATALNAFMSEVKGMNKIRNHAAHSMLADGGDDGAVHISYRNQGIFTSETKPARPYNLMNGAKKISELSNHGATLTIVLEAAIKTWRETHAPIGLPHQLIGERRLVTTQDKPETPPRS